MVACESSGSSLTAGSVGRESWVFQHPRFLACMKDQFQTHPFLDWLKAQKREAQGSLVAVGSTGAVASLPSGPIMAPVWQVGDGWQYPYKSPSDSGTYVWSVNRIEPLDGVQHYVITTSTREIFQRVSDLAISLERVARGRGPMPVMRPMTAAQSMPCVSSRSPFTNITKPAKSRSDGEASNSREE